MLLVVRYCRYTKTLLYYQYKESQPSCSRDQNPETASIFVDLIQSFESVEMDESFSDTDWSQKDLSEERFIRM